MYYFKICATPLRVEAQHEISS